MKLLFDENLSPRLPRVLAPFFPASAQALKCGLCGLPDGDVWEYARADGFTIVSKDGDFRVRSLLQGAPPKVVLLRLGNGTWQQVAQLIAERRADILDLETNPFLTILTLP